MIIGCIYIVNLPEIGGLTSLLTNPAVQPRLNFVPDFSDKNLVVSLLVIPLAVQWWCMVSGEQNRGGGGYIAQRMLSAKKKKMPFQLPLLFNIAHYALRPWPWILIALASLIMYPSLSDIANTFTGIDKNIVNDDLAFQPCYPICHQVFWV